MNKLAEIEIGVSSCLLGAKVRFDSGHKKDNFVTDLLGSFVRYVSVCPELEVGMGVPREAVRLVGDDKAPRMVGNKSGIDWTDKMNAYSSKRIQKNDLKKISGFILKRKSPTCGMERIKVYADKGMPAYTGVGLFARQLMESYPYLPIEEEGRLQDAKIRENFIIRIFAYKRLQDLYAEKFNKNKFIEFHTIHKYLILSHSTKHYQLLGKMIGNIKNIKEDDLKEQYRNLFMESLKLKATVKKHTNVLQHILGFMKNELSAYEKKSVLDSIDDYYNGLVPLIVPITLLKNFIFKYDIAYVKDQTYLNPHPKELMLRNHV